jgi:hypothetical protein
MPNPQLEPTEEAGRKTQNHARGWQKRVASGIIGFGRAAAEAV